MTTIYLCVSISRQRTRRPGTSHFAKFNRMCAEYTLFDRPERRRQMGRRNGMRCRKGRNKCGILKRGSGWA